MIELIMLILWALYLLGWAVIATIAVAIIVGIAEYVAKRRDRR